MESWTLFSLTDYIMGKWHANRWARALMFCWTHYIFSVSYALWE